MYLHLCLFCMCTCTWLPWSTCGEHERVSSPLPLCVSWGSNLGHQTWWQWLHPLRQLADSESLYILWCFSIQGLASLGERILPRTSQFLEGRYIVIFPTQNQQVQNLSPQPVWYLLNRYHPYFKLRKSLILPTLPGAEPAHTPCPDLILPSCRKHAEDSGPCLLYVLWYILFFSLLKQ